MKQFPASSAQMQIAGAHPPRASARGFTVIEMLVTLAIGTILTTAGVPTFASFVANQRATSAARDLMQDLIMARSEASRTGLRVRLVPAGGGWEQGWTVLRDAEAGDTTEALIDATPNSIDAVDFSLCGGVAAAPTIEFASLGELSVPLNGVTALIAAHVAGQTSVREVTILPSGRAESRRVAVDAACS